MKPRLSIGRPRMNIALRRAHNRRVLTVQMLIDVEGKVGDEAA